ncbi:large ribosomal subunit protein eL20z-like [Wolffia australiana]
MGGEEKEKYKPPPPAYGTFQRQIGPSSYPTAPPVIGYPQPGVISSSSADPILFSRGYQNVPGTIQGHPVIEPRLPCFGIGLGWFLFIVGFFLAAIPWYIGAFLYFCSAVDRREKAGYVACSIAAALALVAVIIGATA